MYQVFLCNFALYLKGESEHSCYKSVVKDDVDCVLFVYQFSPRNEIY